MQKKGLLITLLVFLVVLGLAAVLYPRLSAGMDIRQLGTATAVPEQTQPTTLPPTEAPEQTPPTTEAPEETEAPTEATEAAQREPVAAPDFTALDWDGSEARLSDYLGKPIVLNFWAHWCGPCQMEMPHFNEAHQRLGDEVTFLMVHTSPDAEAGKEMVTVNGYTFPVLFDTEDAAGWVYGVNAYPTTFFIDKDGNLQAYYTGAMDAALLQQGVDLIYSAE